MVAREIAIFLLRLPTDSGVVTLLLVVMITLLILEAFILAGVIFVWCLLGNACWIIGNALVTRKIEQEMEQKRLIYFASKQEK